jgi:hypothetical protein
MSWIRFRDSPVIGMRSADPECLGVPVLLEYNADLVLPLDWGVTFPMTRKGDEEMFATGSADLIDAISSGAVR